MTLYLFLGIPAKCNLPVENFHQYGVQSSQVKDGRSVFPMQQNLSDIQKILIGIKDTDESKTMHDRSNTSNHLHSKE